MGWVGGGCSVDGWGVAAAGPVEVLFPGDRGYPVGLGGVVGVGEAEAGGPERVLREEGDHFADGLGLPEALVISQALLDLAIDLLVVGDFLSVGRVRADSEFDRGPFPA